MHVQVYSICYLFIILFIFYDYVYCNITVLWLLWQSNFPLLQVIQGILNSELFIYEN